MFEPELETAEQNYIKNLQLERLKETIRHICKSNPLYAKKLGGAACKDIKNLDDIQKFPLLTKDDLREGYPFKFACAPLDRIVRFHMSSGTTGTPVLNPYTEKDRLQWGRMMARSLSTATVTLKDIVQITPSFGLFNGGFGFHYGCETLGALIVPVGPGRTQLQLKFIKELGVTVFTGIASYPLRIMELARNDNFSFKKTNLRVGIFGAEVWSDLLRKRIEEEMNIETFDIIGMTETGGIGLGIDCTVHNGIHIWEDEYFVEIISPETGKPVKDGKEGELVVTTLTREGLPLIRYRTRDITRIISREKCACGRTSLRIDRIKGRNDDMLKVKGVNFYPRQIEEILLKHPEIGNQYRLVLETYMGKEKVILEAECMEKITEDIKEKLLTDLYDFLGFHIDLKLSPFGVMERGEGKAVRVIDRRSK